MPIWFWAILALILVVDGGVIATMVHRQLAKQGLSFTKLRAVSKLVHERAGEYLRANYSGHLDDLPQALGGFLPLAGDIARSNGCDLTPHSIELMVKTSVVTHRIATRPQVEAAMAQAQHPTSEQRAA